jgi:squalene-hopene/tetraprenyl-beta-curcumene cyclase
MLRPFISAALILSLSACLPAEAQTSSPDPNQQAQQLIDRGLAFLESKQLPDGGWNKDPEPPALTALVLRCFARNPQADEPSMQKGLDRLLSYQKPDGGIYADINANYNTAIAISLLATANNPKYKPQLDRAIAFLKGLQWSDQPSEAKDRQTVPPTDNRFGGFGYGHSQRPDGSNLQIALDALHDAGLKPSDPAFQNAIKFVSRMQNNSETNDQPWAGNDGGFIYTPANGGASMAGEIKTPDGKRFLRSYGSMTYAGLKSMIYAGLTKDDPRVKAAYQWITKHWSLDENPGMRDAAPELAQQGLYYYYHTLARTMNAYDQAIVTDTSGTPHDWRIELVHKLAALQKPDGSWVGEKRWMEDNPVLVTSYVVTALQEAQQDLKEHPPK